MVENQSVTFNSTVDFIDSKNVHGQRAVEGFYRHAYVEQLSNYNVPVFASSLTIEDLEDIEAIILSAAESETDLANETDLIAVLEAFGNCGSVFGSIGDDYF